MSRRFASLWFGWAVVLAGLFLVADSPDILAQGKPKELLWTHAFDLACRKIGESEFTKETQKFGIEAFKDTNNDLGLFLSQVGSLAGGTGFQDLKPPIAGKGPEWLTGLDLPARKAGEKEFTKDTKVHSMEVFRDPNTENWIYITEKGNIAVTAAKVKAAPGSSKAPKWVHSVDLSVRSGGIKEWKDAKKYGLEVYRDHNNANLIYISETGHIAVLPEGAETKPGAEGKAPEWLHGLDLACRKFNEPSFTKDTKKFGVEVFQDANNGNLIFLCETGALAVTSGSKTVKAPTPNVKEPRWTHGLNLKVRKVGEKEFSNTTTVFGAEVFRDENVGAVIYIGETGSISAVAK